MIVFSSIVFPAYDVDAKIEEKGTVSVRTAQSEQIPFLQVSQ